MEENKTYTTIEGLNRIASQKYFELLKDNKLNEIVANIGKFPDLALVNNVLVLDQMPEATKIYSKEEWEFKGRDLIESPKFINKISHCLYKLDQGNTDSKGTLYVRGIDKLSSRLGTVYDISQTIGKEMPQEIDIELIAKYFDQTKQSLEHTAKNYKIVYDDIDKKSALDKDSKTITVQNGMSLNEVITELIDKVSTVLLDSRKQEGITSEQNKKIKDIEHDMAVYAIHARYNLDLPEVDFKEVANFSEEEMKSFKDNLQKVRSVVYQLTHNLENSIEFKMKGLDKKQEKTEQKQNSGYKSNTKSMQDENEVF